MIESFDAFSVAVVTVLAEVVEISGAFDVTLAFAVVVVTIFDCGATVSVGRETEPSVVPPFEQAEEQRISETSTQVLALDILIAGVLQTS